MAAAVLATTAFDHGTWLVAYLFLVGFLGQILLAWGQDALYGSCARTPPAALVRTEAGLWNLGVVAVPLGVLMGERISVVIGSAALLAALTLFARSLRPSRKPVGAISTAMAYAVLLLAIATSVAIGTGLAWDIPWV